MSSVSSGVITFKSAGYINRKARKETQRIPPFPANGGDRTAHASSWINSPEVSPSPCQGHPFGEGPRDSFGGCPWHGKNSTLLTQNFCVVFLLLKLFCPFHRDGQASKSLLPPAFFSKRISSITMLWERALHMS